MGSPEKVADGSRDGQGKGERDGGRESWDADGEGSRKDLGNRIRSRNGSESEHNHDLGEHFCSTR